MVVIPAIDLLEGGCVRLRRGDYGAVTRYDSHPAEVAARFFCAGARRLHVVDLDAARDGRVVNGAAVRAILAVAREFDAVVQVGGGLRDEAAVANVLEAGAGFAILGTAAVTDAAFRRRMIEAYPGRIVVGVDVRDGVVAVAGWRESGGVYESDFLRELHEAPPAAVVYTDICRDGMLEGSNVTRAVAAAAAAPCPLIASGGVGGGADVRALREGGGIAGVVVGRALYTGDLSVEEAMAAAAE